MIRVLSISFGEYTKVTYMKHNGRCDETYQLKTKDLYRPEMIHQYEKNERTIFTMVSNIQVFSKLILLSRYGR